MSLPFGRLWSLNEYVVLAGKEWIAVHEVAFVCVRPCAGDRGAVSIDSVACGPDRIDNPPFEQPRIEVVAENDINAQWFLGSISSMFRCFLSRDIVNPLTTVEAARPVDEREQCE